MYCSNCGAQINDCAVVCVHCGVAIHQNESLGASSTLSNEWLMTVLFCIFGGCLGIHRFYVKDNQLAVIQLVLGLVSCFAISQIWALVDLVMLLTGNFKTGDGRLLSQQ